MGKKMRRLALAEGIKPENNLRVEALAFKTRQRIDDPYQAGRLT
jgi:hypothetical protein